MKSYFIAMLIGTLSSTSIWAETPASMAAKRSAEGMNKILPVVMDDGSKLVSVTSKGDSLIYEILVDEKVLKSASMTLEAFIAKRQKGACGDNTLRNIMAEGVRLELVARSGAKKASALVDAKKCGVSKDEVNKISTEDLQEMIAATSGKLPLVIDKSIEFTSIRLANPKEVVYTYTLTSPNRSSSAISAMKQNIRTSGCNDVNSLAIIKGGVTITFEYIAKEDKDKTPFVSISNNRDVCGL